MNSTPNDAEILAHLKAIRAGCLAGLHPCPPSTQGGYSVSWMRRTMLGACDVRNVRSGRLMLLMAQVGFVPLHSHSTTFILSGQER
jgi:hypothetical protein